MAAAADTSEPKADPKGKLIQALKLPLSLVPKAAKEADEKKISIQLGPPEHDDHHLSPTKSDSSSSLAPKPYTPRLLQRLSILQKRTSHDGSESRTSSPPVSPSTSPQSSLQATPLPTRGEPPLPPLPPTPCASPTTSQESPSQETPLMSPRISPLISPQTSPPHTQATSVPTSSTSDTSLGSAQEKKLGHPSEQSKQPPTPGSPEKQGTEAKKPEGAVIKVDGDDEPPPPPPKKPEDITIWQLLLRKEYLMKSMTADFELPNEEDLLDRFSIIDLYSRRVFPSFFFLLFTIYWVLFNYYIADEFEKEETRVVSDGLVN